MEHKSREPLGPQHPPPVPSFPAPFSLQAGKSGTTPAHASGARSAPRDVRGLAPALKPRPPGRKRRPGRGASGPAPSRAERGRAEPSSPERGRAEPSRAARSRLVQLRPRRPAVRGSGVAAASAGPAPAARPPAGREARSAGRAARPRAPPPPLPGERPPRPAGPARPRDCQSPCVCLSLPVSPPCLRQLPPATPDPPALPAAAASPSRPLPRVFLSAASTPMRAGSAPSPRSPAFAPSVSTPPTQPRGSGVQGLGVDPAGRSRDGSARGHGGEGGARRCPADPARVRVPERGAGPRGRPGAPRRGGRSRRGGDAGPPGAPRCGSRGPLRAWGSPCPWRGERQLRRGGS